MTEGEIKQLAGLWAMYAAYYRTKLDDQVLRMYAEDLADFDLNQVRSALDQYRKNPKNRIMPLPAMIRDILDPECDPDAEAREIAARIGGAIVKYGWNNTDAARLFIGETGWGVVERRGGWMHLCQNHGHNIDPTAFEAQIREQAKATIKYGEGNISPIGIAPGVRRGELQSIGEIMSLPKPSTETEGA